MRKPNKKRSRRRAVKEQVRDIKVEGLPNPNELAAKIAASGASAEEIMGWLGAVLTRAGMVPPTEAGAEVEVAEEIALAPPPPTPAAVEERFENNLLNTLLGEIKRNSRRKK
tara:strand:+ start:546 stop:881 length:336 start_codon:yes stop_codon:yes gene_type:complete